MSAHGPCVYCAAGMPIPPPVPMWTVEPALRDSRGRIRWYQLRWTGPRLAYCVDGFTMGLYRLKRDALARAWELNTHEART